MTDLSVKPGKGFNLAPGFSFKASLNGNVNFLCLVGIYIIIIRNRGLRGYNKMITFFNAILNTLSRQSFQYLGQG